MALLDRILSITATWAPETHWVLAAADSPFEHFAPFEPHELPPRQ